jgi:hypothetical protein
LIGTDNDQPDIGTPTANGLHSFHPAGKREHIHDQVG